MTRGQRLARRWKQQGRGGGLRSDHGGIWVQRRDPLSCTGGESVYLIARERKTKRAQWLIDPHFSIFILVVSKWWKPAVGPRYKGIR